MTDTPDLPTLDALHAEATPGEWEWWTSNSMRRLTAKGGPDGGVIHAFTASDGVACVGVRDEDMACIEALHNAYPALSARIRELEEHVEAIKTISKRGKRIALLEETLRGIRQEKERDREAAIGLEASHEELDQQIAWIDRVLRGEAT